MVGLENGHICKNLTQMVNPRAGNPEEGEANNDPDTHSFSWHNKTLASGLHVYSYHFILIKTKDTQHWLTLDNINYKTKDT